MRRIDFFYFFGSVYAYPSIVRIRGLAEASGVIVNWRPFNVRPLMKENNVALRSEVMKVAYMWRDIARRTATVGVPFVRPPIWPTDPDLLHNMVGIVAAKRGWIEAFTVESYKAWFIDGMRLGERSCLEQVLSGIGEDTDSVLHDAQSTETAEKLALETAVARSHGIFGSPSFVTQDGEMFWGDDRLGEALAWATGQHSLLVDQKRS